MLSEKDKILVAEVEEVLQGLKKAGYTIELDSDKVNTLYNRYLEQFKTASKLILLSNAELELKPIQNPRKALDDACIKADDVYAVLEAFGRKKPSSYISTTKEVLKMIKNLDEEKIEPK